ncbi:MAG: LysR family transcriptional regulator [Gammaproteobacteria bacterium]|nr:LysR family transcriptional regulator [Gammaproteobacteria bacterium]MBV9620710.1 LysR family transcriptional regulator [Gammaproteobacteria bacterium]
MKPNSTPVNWLRTFEVAARNLSLTAAAAELHVTPAAVSQQVRHLEHRLGETLFIRHARGLRLTSAGEALLPACRDSFARLDGAVRELFGERHRERLVVRVSLGFVSRWLLDRLASFADACPQTPMRLVVTVWGADLLDPGVDVDIRIAPGPAAGMESHQLTQDEIFPVCSPALAKAPPRLRQPADLRSRRLLSAIGFAQGWRQWFAAAGVEYQESPPPLECDSMRLSLELAAQGHGVALARTSYVADFLRSRQLRILFGVRIPAADNVYLTVASGLPPLSPAARFRDWILTKSKETPFRPGGVPRTKKR